jgi:hypothetical protein
VATTSAGDLLFLDMGSRAMGLCKVVRAARSEAIPSKCSGMLVGGGRWSVWHHWIRKAPCRSASCCHLQSPHKVLKEPVEQSQPCLLRKNPKVGLQQHFWYQETHACGDVGAVRCWHSDNMKPLSQKLRACFAFTQIFVLRLDTSLGGLFLIYENLGFLLACENGTIISTSKNYEI